MAEDLQDMLWEYEPVAKFFDTNSETCVSDCTKINPAGMYKNPSEVLADEDYQNVEDQISYINFECVCNDGFTEYKGGCYGCENLDPLCRKCDASVGLQCSECADGYMLTNDNSRCQPVL